MVRPKCQKPRRERERDRGGQSESDCLSSNSRTLRLIQKCLRYIECGSQVQVDPCHIQS